MENDTQNGALLHAILEAAVDAMIVSNGAGLIVNANPAACDLFQYDASEMIGQNVSMLMPKRMAANHDGYISHHVNTGEQQIIGIGRDVEGQRKDQTVFPLHLSVGHAQVDGKPMFVGILHDLTRRQATQDALARSQRLDAIGQMTGGIAHDFNNLLTVVIGNLELLEMHGVNDKQASLIKDALESAELGADLTERLLIFARKSNLKPVKADLRELCESALSILKRTLGANFRIKTNFDQVPSPVVVDPVQLQSVLMNLALNARDAMVGKGEMLVSIANITIDDTYMAQETDVKPGNYVRLNVSDNGSGMSIEAQRRAFEPFFTTKSDSGGTGLGLAMVYGFVRQSGGHITLYSELGIGTNFGLYFPAATASETTRNASALNDQTPVLPRGNGQTVLVVEDNPKVRKLSIQRIQDLGFKTAQADSGDAAYGMLKDGIDVDVLFSDVVMPGNLNGYELATKVSKEFPHIKILLTTGYAGGVPKTSVENEENYDVIHKPFRQADLAHKLQALYAVESDG